MEIMILANEVNLHWHTIGSGMSEQATGILIFLCFMLTLTLAVLMSRHYKCALNCRDYLGLGTSFNDLSGAD